MMILLIVKNELVFIHINIKILTKQFISILNFVFSVVLVITFANIHFMENQKIDYIIDQMSQHKSEIIIPKIESDYVHGFENNLIEEKYFYEVSGDIKFIDLDYKTWKIYK